MIAVPAAYYELVSTENQEKMTKLLTTWGNRFPIVIATVMILYIVAKFYSLVSVFAFILLIGGGSFILGLFIMRSDA
jgi:hypothetical protein